MTKYILHGGFTREDNEPNKTFYQESTRGLTDNSTILLVYFAREDKDISRIFKEDKERILAQTSCKDLDVVLADKERFVEQIRSADAIYIRGGDTEKLLDTIKQYPTFVQSIQGKVISGSSAGAQLLSRYYSSSSEGGIHEGLGVLPIRIVCHYQSDLLPSKEDPLKLFENYQQELELIVLKDYEWKVFEQ